MLEELLQRREARTQAALGNFANAEMPSNHFQHCDDPLEFQGSPDITYDDLFNTNSNTAKTLVEVFTDNCPDAFTHINIVGGHAGEALTPEPKKPPDRVPLKEGKTDWHTCLDNNVGFKSFAVSKVETQKDVKSGVRYAMEYAESKAVIKDFPPFGEAIMKKGIDYMGLVMVDPYCVGYHRNVDAPSRRLATPFIFCRTENGYMYYRLGVKEAFTDASRTWEQWVDADSDRNHTTIIFVGYSTSHFKTGQWDPGGHCHGANDFLQFVILGYKSCIILIIVIAVSNFLEGNSSTIHVYEETIDLMVNDSVLLAHKPLPVEFGPRILYNIFDGIQRPLETIAKRLDDVYIPRGVSVSVLNKDTPWDSQPKKIGEEDLLPGGDLYATVFEDYLMQHHVALLPDAKEKITYMFPIGQYLLKDNVLELEFQGVKKQFTGLQTWLVRTPRLETKLVADTPLFIGQCVLDALFPSVLSGTCALHGAFGCGKIMSSQALSKYSNSDAAILCLTKEIAWMEEAANQTIILILKVFGCHNSSMHEATMLIIGILAYAIEPQFEKYVHNALPTMHGGAKICAQMEIADDEMMNYGNELRRIFGTYHFIFQSFKSMKSEVIMFYAQNLLKFIEILSRDRQREERVTKVAVMGDLAEALGSNMNILFKDCAFYDSFLGKCLQCDVEQIKQIAGWAQGMINLEKLHAGAINRVGSQIIPATMKVFYALQLTAKPRLFEQNRFGKILAHEQTLGIYKVLNRGHAFEELQKLATPLSNTNAYLLVIEFFGFSNQLEDTTHLLHGAIYSNGLGKVSNLLAVVDYYMGRSYYFTTPFSQIDPWGQGSFGGEGNVMNLKVAGDDMAVNGIEWMMAGAEGENGDGRMKNSVAEMIQETRKLRKEPSKLAGEDDNKQE